MLSFFLLKVFLFVFLTVSAVNGRACSFSCSSNCLKMITKQTLANGSVKLTVSASSCQSSGTVSWIACLNSGCSATSCDGNTPTSSNKCSSVQVATFLFPATALTGLGASLQMGDPSQGGNIVCTTGSGSNCLGSSSVTCTVSGSTPVSGVCQIDFLNNLWNNPDFSTGKPQCSTSSQCVASDLCAVQTCTSGFCKQTVAPSTQVCRASAGVCDVTEKCDGTNLACPTNSFSPSTTMCRAAMTYSDSTSCDVAEYCTGSGANCPNDQYKASGVTCRPTAGSCDVQETCSGSSPQCPTDQFASSSTVCRPKVVNSDGTSCDIEEKCTGSSATCPADQVVASGTSCRNAAGLCDNIETCNGVSNSCPNR